MQPRATSLFLPSHSLSSRPPFDALGLIQAPFSTPVGSLLQFTSFLRHFQNHSLPLPASTVRLVPSVPQEGSCLHSWSPTLLCCASSSPAPVPFRLLVSSRSSCLYMVALLRVFERPWEPPLPVSFPPPPSSLRSSVVQVPVHRTCIGSIIFYLSCVDIWDKIKRMRYSYIYQPLLFYFFHIILIFHVNVIWWWPGHSCCQCLHIRIFLIFYSINKILKTRTTWWT